MLYTTIDTYAQAAGVCDDTAGRRLKHVAYRSPSRASGRRFYPVAAAVMTLKQREIAAGAIPALVDSSGILGTALYIEAEMLPTAIALSEWLPDEAMRARLREMHAAFVGAVANSPLCTPTVVRALEPLKTLFVLNKDVTSYVLTGDGRPDVADLAPAFAVSCNDALLERQYAALTTNEITKEAA